MSTIERVKNLKENECIVDVLLREVSSHVCKDCGKCVFGYEGITQLEMILKDITEKKGKQTDIALMQELCGMMKEQALCSPGGPGSHQEAMEMTDAILMALDTYRSDFEEHIGKKGCRAGVCKKFMTYHILPEKCTGCNECVDSCEDDAILGRKRFIHVIDQDECIQCGACVEACDEDAIVRAGAVKPRCPKKPIPCKRR